MSNSVTPATSYDEIPYPGGAYPQSHPERLAAIAALFGLTPPDVETARILEVGCSIGNNLIPMADLLPGAEFLGIDLSAREIAEGKKTIAALGLSNIELRQADLREFRDRGKFDFIITHGVYSWITPEMQGRLLRLVKEQLSPRGIAYISYNTLPGWRMRGMIRDMMLRHTRRFAATTTKIQQARALLAFLAEAAQRQDDPYVQFLKFELQLLRDQPDDYLFHEHLEAENNPLYFQDFVAQAAAAGLRYLADSNVCIMFTSNLHPAAQRFFASAPSLVDIEQYADFLCNRMFRMSLLVHDDQQPTYQFAARRVGAFHIVSRLQARDAAANLLSPDSIEFVSPAGSLHTNSPLAKAAMQILAEVCPASMACDELLRQACARIGRAVPTEAGMLDPLLDEIGTAVFKGYTGLPPACVELFTHALPVACRPGERPRASRLSRYRAAGGDLFINACHQPVRLAPFERELIPLLTGENDRSALLEMMETKVKQRRFEVRENNELVVDPQRLHQFLLLQLEASLNGLAKNALLLSS